MATTYWDFDTDKPTEDMTLKADYKLKKVAVRFFDNTQFLSNLYSNGEYNMPHVNGYKYQQSGSRILSPPSGIVTVTGDIADPSTGTSGAWCEVNIIGWVNLNLKDTYGLSTDDSIGIIIASSSSLNNYLVGGTMPPSQESQFNNVWGAFRQKPNWEVRVEQANQASWAKLSAGCVDGTSKRYDLFITRYCKAGSYVIQPTAFSCDITCNRARFVEVDYGTTFQQLADMVKHPIDWKTADGKTLAWYQTWTRTSDGATWQSLMSQPITQTTTLLVKWQ